MNRIEISLIILNIKQPKLNRFNTLQIRTTISSNKSQILIINNLALIELRRPIINRLIRKHYIPNRNRRTKISCNTRIQITRSIINRKIHKIRSINRSIVTNIIFPISTIYQFRHINCAIRITNTCKHFINLNIIINIHRNLNHFRSSNNSSFNWRNHHNFRISNILSKEISSFRRIYISNIICRNNSHIMSSNYKWNSIIAFKQIASTRIQDQNLNSSV